MQRWRLVNRTRRLWPQSLAVSLSEPLGEDVSAARFVGVPVSNWAVQVEGYSAIWISSDVTVPLPILVRSRSAPATSGSPCSSPGLGRRVSRLAPLLGGGQPCGSPYVIRLRPHPYRTDRTTCS